MSQKTFSFVAAVVFGLIALGHVLRLIWQPPISIAGWSPPTWGSAVALVFFAFLAFEGFRGSRKG